MLFWLKKTVSFWLMPLPACLTLMIAGLILTGRERRRRLGRILLVTGLTLLVAFSNKAVSRWLIAPLEAVYPPIPELTESSPVPAALAACRYIVVLGGGHGDMRGLPAASKLSTSAIGRLAEGVRLARVLPDAAVIVSGPPEGRGETHARILARAAESLGLAERRIRLIETARDTEDEAQAVKAIAGDGKVALVTSAWHMPRAAGLFRKAGVAVLPCPADYRGKPNPDFRWTDYSWDVESLDRSTFAVREYIGYCWVWLRGKV
ncbi:MAG TPA: ElyC/SanA/YdcF family protein [Opitutaceae bacterium]|nr:ElyC/SanA/YdcF family protein [Opitutaceae bacterium]